MSSILEVRNVVKQYGDYTALNSVSLEVPQGSIYGLLGPNGAGKTTAMRMLCGLSKPSSGNATIAGYDVYRETEEIKKNIGYMSQKFSLYEDLTVLENIRFFGGIYGLTNNQLKTKSEELIERLGLESEAKKLVGSLPLGWKQKLSFSVAVLHEPKIVFLDEPTGGVDPVTRRQFWDLIYAAAENGVTIFVTTHYMDEAEYLCDRVAIIDSGKIIAMDSPDKLIDDLVAGGFERPKEMKMANLEDVFIHLTGHSLREG